MQGPFKSFTFLKVFDEFVFYGDVCFDGAFTVVWTFSGEVTVGTYFFHSR